MTDSSPISEPARETEPSRVYLDHAATSWPKPAGVREAVDRFARVCGAAAGRGSYRSAVEAGHVIESLRRRLAETLAAESPRCVSFHPSGTSALNAAIHGVVRDGDHVVTTEAEHNSVLRPLWFLRQHRGVEVTVVPVDTDGRVDPDELIDAVRDQTRLVAVTHASNVTGAIQPIHVIGERLRHHSAALLCDAAQTFGYLPIDVRAAGIDLLATPGHKGGRGPMGTGLLYVAEPWHREIRPFIQGGTGSESESLEMPDTMPSKLEPGIVNVAALAGWLAAIEDEAEQSQPQSNATETNEAWTRLAGLGHELRRRLAKLSGTQVIGPTESGPTESGPNQSGPNQSGPQSDEDRSALPIVSLTFEAASPADVASILDVEFGIEVRAGLHCAGLLHPRLGTEHEGTLRISGGHPTTSAEVDAVVDAIGEIVAGMS